MAYGPSVRLLRRCAPRNDNQRLRFDICHWLGFGGGAVSELYFVKSKLKALPPPVIDEIQTLENLRSFGASSESLKARA